MSAAVRAVRSPLRTPDGWELTLRRGLRAGRPAPGPPVLLVPGYGMNASIFDFHPGGPSFLEHLYDAGFDPWTVDLRGTSTSRPPRSDHRVTLSGQAWTDVPAALQRVAEVSGHPRVHAIGCSLGGALLYAHVGRDEHLVDKLVTMGTPLAWRDLALPHKAFRAAGHLVGALPVRGTRLAARTALPLLARVAPDLLSFYLNPRVTDTTNPGRLAGTVEDPHPDISRNLARWMRDEHLALDAHHVTEGLGRFSRPLMVVVAEGDGIVPPTVSEVAMTATGGPATLLRVGHPEHRVSHVDLFIGDHVHDAVYAPITDWLRAA